MKQLTTNQFRHYIQIQRRTNGSVDSYGQRTVSWSEHRSVWAKLEVKQAGESRSGDRLTQTTTYQFTIRFVPGVSAQCRLLYRGKFYAVDAVTDPDGRGIYLVIDASLDDSKRVSGEVV